MMKARVKLTALLVPVALLVLVPATASADGATVIRAVMPFNGFLGLPLGCDGPVLYGWLHEGPFPDAVVDPDYLLEGMAVLAPETAPGRAPDLMNFKADGAEAWVWQASDLAAYCSGGVWDVLGFAMDLYIYKTAELIALAGHDGNVSIKWNQTYSDTHIKDSLVVTGEHLTLKSMAVFKAVAGVPVELLNEFTQVNWH